MFTEIKIRSKWDEWSFMIELSWSIRGTNRSKDVLQRVDQPRKYKRNKVEGSGIVPGEGW